MIYRRLIRSPFDVGDIGAEPDDRPIVIPARARQGANRAPAELQTTLGLTLDAAEDAAENNVPEPDAAEADDLTIGGFHLQLYQENTGIGIRLANVPLSWEIDFGTGKYLN